MAAVPKTQGLLIPLEAGARKNTLYIHYTNAFTNLAERIALAWQGDSCLELHAYASNLFLDFNFRDDVLHLSQPHYRELLGEFHRDGETAKGRIQNIRAKVYFIGGLYQVAQEGHRISFRRD